MEKVKLKKLIEKAISGEWGSEGDQISIIRSTNFTNEGRLNLKEIVTRNIDRKKVESKKLQKGDIIIEKSGGSPTQPVGRVVYFDLEGTYLCNNFTSVLRPRSEIIHPKYLHYQLFSSHKFGLTNGFQNKTTGIINLKLDRYINDLEIPLPPLPTQQKIAAILDKADELRQYNKQLIEKYEALTQSLFLDMFGDPVRNEKGFELVTIRDLCNEVKYGTSEKASEEGKYPYLRMNNITYSGYMNFKNLKYVNLTDKDLPKYIVKKGDILFNRTNSKELVGKTGIITNDDIYVIAGYLIRVRTNKLANPYFIWGHLNSKWAKLTLNNMCKNIVGMANINAQELQDIKILQAPIALQNQFAERVQAIETQKQQAQEALEKSEQLFQGLLQKAFKGELN
ncbi:type I restriction enzyme S subunit [Flavobacterium sp. 7E]|uniref:restriction endonuclease subunit S n=1 Tax=Flavobacterium sp. 7E TaxID=2735898 RepID=UPI00156D6B02|nr:restriction endonuclease subunit S [Flavobacterium sp. 7E]NRS87774.1 type I restriction enzyme S subunit [Flavobacterium sp. 7E]